MLVWLDAQLPPGLAQWMTANLSVSAISFRDLGFREAPDSRIFLAARSAEAVLMSKDSDFVDLVQRLGSPPQLVWLTCGNLTNARLRAMLIVSWPSISALLDTGEPIVELGDRDA